MVSNNLPPRPKRNYLLFWVAIIVLALIGSWFIRGQMDKKIADNVYQQLVKFDGQLDALQNNIQQEQQQRALNQQIITLVRGLTPQNYAENQNNLKQLVESSAQYPVNNESDFSLLISGTTAKNYKFNKRGFKEKLRILKYNDKQVVTEITHEIDEIKLQLAVLQTKVDSIHGESLRELEQAKLGFIKHKLTKTNDLIKSKVVDEAVEAELANYLSDDDDN